MLLGLAAISTTQLEFLITTNHRNGTAMLYLAEAGLEHAREFIDRVVQLKQEDLARQSEEIDNVVATTPSIGKGRRRKRRHRGQ